MSLQQLMDSAQSLGRGPDTMLVHMAPAEVQSLQSLAEHHGGSLTVNPHTGLPEAGFLTSILPTIVGGALSVASGGTLSPLLIAAMTGAGTGLATGSISKGLLAGLGAFGGAGIGSGLMNLGADAAASAAAPALSAPTASTGIAAGGADLVTPMVQAPTLGESIAGNFSNFGKGIGEAFANPAAGLEAVGGAKGLASAGLMALAPSLGGGAQRTGAGPAQDLGMIRPFTYNQTPVANRQPGQRYFNSGFTAGTPQPAGGFKGFADGGIAAIDDSAPQGQFSFVQKALANDPSGRRFEQKFVEHAPAQTAQTGQTGLASIFGGEWPPKDPYAGLSFKERIDRLRDPGMQQQAFIYDLYQGYKNGNNGAAFDGYAQGGLTQGPGDGMSDSIPAVIDGRAPAAIATDEFIIPADVVSQLGNGSTNAGAKELHAMMDRIRHAAHGSKRQQHQVDPRAVVPA